MRLMQQVILNFLMKVNKNRRFLVKKVEVFKKRTKWKL